MKTFISLFCFITGMPAKRLKNPIPVMEGIRIKYKDVFSLKDFYEALYYWIREQGYGDIDEGDEKFETYYGERIGREGMKEIWATWRLMKKP